MTKPSFGLTTTLYALFSVIAIVFSPLIIVYFISLHHAEPKAIWALASLVVVIFIGLLVITSRVISTKSLNLQDYILYITAYCITGWVNSSILIVFPALVFSLFYFVVVGCLYGLFGKPEQASSKAYNLVMFFHRNRMRQ